MPEIGVDEPAGDWQRWDRIWRGIRETGNDATLYTRGRPRSLLEFWQRAYFEDLWASMGPRAAEAKCLELGSGRGTTSMYLAERCCDVTLVDRSPAALELAVQNFRSFGLRRPTILAADARSTGLPSEAYDCIYNIGLLEHFDDPLPVLTEALRLLKPRGLIFMVIVPAGPRWRLPLVRFALNPGVMAWRLVTAVGRGVAARVRPHQTVPLEGANGDDDDMVRTSHSREQYVRWMRELGHSDVTCVPYNPYFSIYRSRALERAITLPLYRWHLRLRRQAKGYPSLQTHATASCDLLMGRKHA
jgi:SAM-dependent methyltransferase